MTQITVLIFITILNSNKWLAEPLASISEPHPCMLASQHSMPMR